MSKGLGANGVTAIAEANTRYFINQQQDLLEVYNIENDVIHYHLYPNS